MKDLEQKDILNRTRTKLTRFSIYTRGSWRFGRLLSPTIIAENQSIYRMNVPFALIDSGETNPRAAKVRGVPGDYLASDSFGELVVITEEQYNLRFPTRRRQPYRTETSEKLKDGNYITEIVRDSQSVRSNTTSGRRRSGGVLSPSQTQESQTENLTANSTAPPTGPGGSSPSPTNPKSDGGY